MEVEKDTVFNILEQGQVKQEGDEIEKEEIKCQEALLQVTKGFDRENEPDNKEKNKCGNEGVTNDTAVMESSKMTDKDPVNGHLSSNNNYIWLLLL